MSERAREFLDHWLADHVASVDDTRRLRETVRLVTLCREDAVRAGLAPEELRKASGGDLIGTVLVALSAAAAPATVPALAGEGAPGGGGRGSSVGHRSGCGRDQGDLRRQGPQPQAPRAMKCKSAASRAPSSDVRFIGDPGRFQTREQKPALSLSGRSNARHCA